MHTVNKNMLIGARFANLLIFSIELIGFFTSTLLMTNDDAAIQEDAQHLLLILGTAIVCTLMGYPVLKAVTWFSDDKEQESRTLTNHEKSLARILGSLWSLSSTLSGAGIMALSLQSKAAIAPAALVIGIVGLLAAGGGGSVIRHNHDNDTPTDTELAEQHLSP